MGVIRGEKGLGIIDTLVTLVIIVILMGVLIPKYQGIAEEAREAALRLSLEGIRKAITVYVLVNHRVPPDLETLQKEKLILPIREGTIFTTDYLKSLALDEEGLPIDPFGNRYAYDPNTGRVSSTTKGYKAW